MLLISYSYALYANYGSKKIAPEENCPPALILTLILNQTLTLTGGQFSSGGIFRTPPTLYHIIIADFFILVS